MLIGCDLDGTLTPYNWDGTNISVNPRALDILAGILHQNGGAFTFAAIITNQGGLPFQHSNQDQPPFHRSAHGLVWKVTTAQRAILALGIKPASVHVALWHPNATEAMVGHAEYELRKALKETYQAVHWTIYTTPKARKPSSYMLRRCRANLMIGDSDEDIEAGANAGISTHRVERYWK
jgi:phosphoglycolate phosphatase-like HAD superfamily hydrolase